MSNRIPRDGDDDLVHDSWSTLGEPASEPQLDERSSFRFGLHVREMVWDRFQRHNDVVVFEQQGAEHLPPFC